MSGNPLGLCVPAGDVRSRAVNVLTIARSYRCAARELEAFGGAAAVDGDLEMLGAAEERARRAGVGLRIRRHDLVDRVRAGRDLDRAGAGKPVEDAAVHIGDEVPETIDAQHLPDTAGSDTTGSGTVSVCHAVSGRPRADSSMPFASHAAAGAKRSRPSNVRLTVGRA